MVKRNLFFKEGFEFAGIQVIKFEIEVKGRDWVSSWQIVIWQIAQEFVFQGLIYSNPFLRVISQHLLDQVNTFGGCVVVCGEQGCEVPTLVVFYVIIE